MRKALATFLLLGVLACGAAQAAPVDQAKLDRAMDAYFAALVSHDVSHVPVSAGAKITYDGALAKLTDGPVSSARAVKYRRTFSEPRAGQIGSPLAWRKRPMGVWPPSASA